ncbi:MAG: tetratricopeptide repeat protein [Candidatus Hydrogenedentota bacterium]
MINLRHRLREHGSSVRVVGLIVLVALAGCATRKEYLADPVRNATLQADLKKDPFRGRWWNLYDRAFIFQKYELWEYAEQDIRAALSSRDLDQRWARTYGIHFIPEYFPNRELGVVLFHQGNFDEAIGRLETSVEQYYSARAGYYLDQARAARIAATSPDATNPTIDILSPQEGTLLASTQVNLEFVAKDDNYVSSIFINGEEIPLLHSAAEVSTRELELEHPINVQPGMNVIQVAAEDVSGNRTTISVRMKVDVDGPTVRFDSPLVLPGTVRGVVHDPAGVSEFYIGDVRVELEPDDDNTFSFEGAATEVINVFRCVDNLGNTTEGVIDGPDIAWFDAPALSDAQFASSRRVEALSDDVVAVYQGGKIVGLIRTAQNTAPEAGIRVKFANLMDDQEYYKDEIAVVMQIDSLAPIDSLELNGQTVEGIVPGWTSQRVSRRIRLDEKGDHTISAVIHDVNGKTDLDEVVIKRVLPDVEDVSAKLNVALLGSFSDDTDPEMQQYATDARDELEFVLEEEKRFSVLNRESIDEIIDEQLLRSALGSTKDRETLGQLEIADYLFIVVLKKYGDNVEMFVHAFDSLTSHETIVDVFGPVHDSDDLTNLTYDLALRLEQKFPRVQGNINEIKNGGNSLSSTLKKDQRIRKAMYCVVYRPEEQFGEDPKGNRISLGTNLILIAEGTLSSVKKKGSRIQLLLDESTSDPTTPQLSDLVITK